MTSELTAAAMGAGSTMLNTIGNVWGASKSNRAQKKMARETNMVNMQLANQQMAFQERMSNTAIQRQVADAKAAGVNPLFAVGGGGGASSPSGAMGSATSGGAMQAPNFDMDIGGAVSAYSRIKSEKAQRKIMEEQAKNEVKTGEKIEAETELTKAQKENIPVIAKKTEAETTGIEADNTLRTLKSDAIGIARKEAENKANKIKNWWNKPKLKTEKTEKKSWWESNNERLKQERERQRKRFEYINKK